MKIPQPIPSLLRKRRSSFSESAPPSALCFSKFALPSEACHPERSEGSHLTDEPRLEATLPPLLPLPPIPPLPHSTTASASISTSISGAISLLTSTILVAGRTSPKHSPPAPPPFSH